jgi:hypothetical protein
MIISYIFHITTRTTFLFYLPSNFTILSSIFVTLFSGLHFFFHNYNYKIFFFYFVTSHLLSYFNSLFMNTLMVTLYEMEMCVCVCVCVSVWMSLHITTFNCIHEYYKTLLINFLFLSDIYYTIHILFKESYLGNFI